MTSSPLLAHVKRSEGLSLTVYLDPLGIPTIGYGHVCPRDWPAITEAKAETLLIQDLTNAGNEALRLCPDLTGARLDALTDLVFNIGYTKLKGSGVVTSLNAKEWEDAATRFRNWNKGRKGDQLVALPGLTRRRNALAPWIELGEYV